jgi:hypothetical protein
VTGSSGTLRPLVDALSGALGQSAEAVLGVPVAIDLRIRRDDRGLFVSGVPADLVARVCGAFGVASTDDGAILAERWHAAVNGTRRVGSGPALVSGGTIAVVPAGGDAEGLRERAVALRGNFEPAATRLAASLAEPVDPGALLVALDDDPEGATAALADVAESRALVGRYLLDAADELDDERIDQLGDGYVRAAQRWATIVSRPEPDAVRDALALEHACKDWMQGAAAPPTRYAF